MKRWMSLIVPVLALTLVLLGCQSRKEPEQADIVLYFRVASQVQHGSALGIEPYTGEENPGPEELLQALLSGPSSEGLSTPFPRGVTLQGWEWDPEIPGNLQVRLSEQYGGLTDVSLTLADYCVVLTLAQLEGVETVEILSNGYTVNYRSHQLLAASEPLLTEKLVEGIT